MPVRLRVCMVFSLHHLQSYATLQWFLVAMAHYPAVQEKAYRELMAVVGPSRIPSLTDYDNLLYVRAILKEVLRMWPPTPLGALLFLHFPSLRLLTWYITGVPHSITEVGFLLGKELCVF